MLPGKEPIKTREDDKDETILQEARERAQRGMDGWKHNHDSARDDVAFIAGEQWPEEVRKAREDKGRPVLTLNKLPQYIDQVLGDQRQNRPAIHVHPVEASRTVDSEAIPNINGTQDYTLAEIYEALIRNIEYTSNAEAHYDRAFQHAVEGGFGWLRVLTKYSRDDTFEQDLCISSIANRFSVLMDPDCHELDYSDAMWAMISERMPRAEFRKRYPDAQLGDLTDAGARGMDWWHNEDGVRVAEYFSREPETRKLLLLSDGRTVWHDEVEKVLDELELEGVTVVRERTVQTYKVIWRKITAYSVLEGPVHWPGSTIPIVPVLGKEITVEDKTYYRGLVYHARDAQRMHNYWMTAATERVALAPKAPYIGAAEAIEGYEAEWAAANTENRAILRYNAQYEPPRREAPPAMPAAELQIAMSMTDEMKATTGIYDASLGNQSNETSGRAILARQRQGDRGTFAYIDNLSRAIRRLGIILIELIPRVYDSERVIRVRFEDGTGDWVRINETVIDQQTREEVLVHDISAGKFDVTVKAGPSYQTQRMEAADSLLQFVQAVPSAGGVIADLIAKNMDWPGSQEIAERLRKQLPPNMLTQEEMTELQKNTPEIPPTPEQEVAMAQSQAAQAKAQADMAMAEVKSAEAQAKLRELEIMADMAGPDSLHAMVRNLVAEAMAEIGALQNR